jgi:HAE1 family hydrophobic/amphiphilic exporter-1
MDPIRFAIERPIAVIAAVLMAVLFGALALTRIPIQLIPDVRKPVIEIETTWAGAAPAEIEREIVNRQEDELKGLDGLETMISTSETGRARVTLEFGIGTNMDRALLLVSNRLDRVTGYPDEADEPTLKTSGSDDNPIAWIILKRAPGNTSREMEQYGPFAEDVVKERIERVDGVATVNVYGGVDRELQVLVDPERLARYRLTVPEVLARLRRESVSVSAGNVDEGKRRYIVRVEGELDTLEAVREVVLRSGAARDSAPTAGGAIGPAGLPSAGRVYVRDVAEVRFGYKEPAARIRHKGEPAIAINAIRQTGANVISTMAGIRGALKELRAGPLLEERLTLTQVYDETVYIDGAINLVIQNIWIGGVLAAVILLLFLRSWRATLVVSLAIPVCIVASFVAMSALGRTLNVISLAGIAFAVGMVVDAAIVVLENIFRLRQNGMEAREAAYHGAAQVWGAILVSALTTVMVFIPVLVMELEAGQLFRDIGVAISVSVMLSLVVAVTVIPALSSRLLQPGKTKLNVAPLPIVDHFGRAFAWVVKSYAGLTVRSRIAGILSVVIITTAALWGAATFLPKLEYLPDGNRNLVFGIILPPPGYNLPTTTKIAERLEAVARPLWEKEETGDRSEPPAMNHFFFVSFRGTTFIGGAAKDPTRVRELIPVLSRPIFSEPGTFGFINQRSLFGRGIGGGRAIELNVSGDGLEDILGVALRLTGNISQHLPRDQGNQFRPQPGLELGAPELRAIPDRVRLADAGVDAQTLALSLDAYNDGVRIKEITLGTDRIDLTLKGLPSFDENRRTQDIGAYPVVAPNGRIIPISQIADVKLTAGPVSIRHRERFRTITLEVRPASDLPLETALEIMRTKVMQPVLDEGVPPGVRLSLTGAADQLTKTWDALKINLLLALVIVFLVMAVLFESFILPLVIMISVPVAGAGGVAGLAILNTYQPQQLDMLTLLGFVILIGIVVNNAILLVHQARYHLLADGMSVNDAIQEATRNRIRPIFMSTLTSVFGMLPLVVFPGAGSELYRGLGSVVVGGLTMSAILTLLLVPPLLRLTLRPPAEATEAVAQAAE